MVNRLAPTEDPGTRTDGMDRDQHHAILDTGQLEGQRSGSHGCERNKEANAASESTFAITVAVLLQDS